MFSFFFLFLFSFFAALRSQALVHVCCCCCGSLFRSSETTRAAAKGVAEEVGAKFYATSIQGLFDQNVASYKGDNGYGRSRDDVRLDFLKMDFLSGELGWYPAHEPLIREGTAS